MRRTVLIALGVCACVALWVGLVGIIQVRVGDIVLRSRDPLLARVRLASPAGVPLLAETTRMIATYLTAERGLGRIPIDTDVETLALILVGSSHLLAAGSRPAPFGPDNLRAVVNRVIENVAREPARAART